MLARHGARAYGLARTRIIAALRDGDRVAERQWGAIRAELRRMMASVGSPIGSEKRRRTLQWALYGFAIGALVGFPLGWLATVGFGDTIGVPVIGVSAVLGAAIGYYIRRLNDLEARRRS